MAATIHNFTIEQGTSFDLNIKYTDPSGIPINLSNYNLARMQWNTNKNTSEYFITTNTNSGLYLFEFSSPLSSGLINLKIPSSITSSYTFTTANYDLEIESTGEFYPGGGPEVTRLLQGVITISPEITKN